MENPPPPIPEITRVLALKRFENPPPGFSDRLQIRILRAIAAEQERVSRPWWTRLFEEVTWQRGMIAANALAFAGVAFLAAATFQVAHSVANEEVEGQVYAALPIPPEVLVRAAASPGNDSVLAAAEDPGAYLRPLPSSGGTSPISPVFSNAGEPLPGAGDGIPRGLFNPPTLSNPRFILASER